MNAYRPAAHTRIAVRKTCQSFFSDIASAITHKVSDHAVSLDHDQGGTLFNEVILIEDPKQEFSVKVDFYAYEEDEGIRLAVDLLVLSRQVRRPGRLPTADEAEAMGGDTASAQIFLTRSARSMATFKKGMVVKKLKADVAETLQKGGAFEKAFERAKLVTRHNIKTAKTLAKMEKAGWQPKEKHLHQLQEQGVVAVGEKIFFAFDGWLTPEQAIALREAMAPVLKQSGVSPDELTKLTYDPQLHARYFLSKWVFEQTAATS